MQRTGSLAPGVFTASLAAGPIFVVTYTLADMYMRLPAPISFDPLKLASFLMVLMISLVVGTFLAIVPNVMGANAMALLSDQLPPARLRIIWGLVGALAGAGLARLFTGDLASTEAFAIIITSSASAMICRSINWTD